MSTSLYNDAIIEAKQLKKMAEENAKNKLVDEIMPKITALIEKRLIGEEIIDEEEFESEMEDDEEFDEELSDDEVVDDSEALVPTDDDNVEIFDLSNISADGEFADDDSFEGVGDEFGDDDVDNPGVTINVQGDGDVHVHENTEMDMIENICQILDRGVNRHAVKEKAKTLKKKASRFKKICEALQGKAPLSRKEKAMLGKYYKKLNLEAKALRSELILNE